MDVGLPHSLVSAYPVRSCGFFPWVGADQHQQLKKAHSIHNTLNTSLDRRPQAKATPIRPCSQSA